MLFNSLAFLIFFPIAVMIYFIIPHRTRYIWLLLCSYFFYICQDSGYAALLVISTVITWLSGQLLYNTQKSSSKKLILSLSLLINIGLLVFFKYSGLILSIFGNEKSFSLILPAGISFYTFQSLTYVIDCYRKKCPPEKNILKYALFVSFFPCILSGPIERASHLLPQFDEEHFFDTIRAKEGLFMMLWGYFLKMVIVARLSILTDLVYSN